MILPMCILVILAVCILRMLLAVCILEILFMNFGDINCFVIDYSYVYYHVY